MFIHFTNTRELHDLQLMFAKYLCGRESGFTPSSQPLAAVSTFDSFSASANFPQMYSNADYRTENKQKKVKFTCSKLYLLPIFYFSINIK